MSEPNSSEMHRDLGRLEGRLAAMEDRFERVEQMLDRIDARLARIESRESQLRGAWWVLAAVSSGIGAVAWSIIGHFWK